MKTIIQTMGIAVVMILFTGLGSGTALADTIEGTVQGLQCVVSGKICPIDNQDPHIAAERNFVVYTEGKGYHFVSNLNRSILARYFSKKVRVEGKVSSKYDSITANKFQVYLNGKWQTKWTLAQEMEERRELNLGNY